jgi:hypothetical protein
MQYILLIYENEKIYGADKTGSAMQEIVAKHMAFSRELGSVRVSGAGLKGTSAASTVRTANARQTIHDGPFAETKEQLGGYYLVDVPNLDEAIEIAKKLPLLSDGAVEVRPLLGPG